MEISQILHHKNGLPRAKPRLQIFKELPSYSWFKSLYRSQLETENYFNKSGFLGIRLLDTGIRRGIIFM